MKILAAVRFFGFHIQQEKFNVKPTIENDNDSGPPSIPSRVPDPQYCRYNNEQ
jgi:hypothetical protein